MPFTEKNAFSWIAGQSFGMAYLLLSTSEDRLEAGFDEDAFHFFALIALDLDAAVLDGATDAAGFLHFFREFLLFCEADAGEIPSDGDALSAAMRGLTNDVDPAAVGVFLSTLGGFYGDDRSGRTRGFRSRR